MASRDCSGPILSPGIQDILEFSNFIGAKIYLRLVADLETLVTRSARKYTGVQLAMVS